jgi:hypothetical protein
MKCVLALLEWDQMMFQMLLTLAKHDDVVYSVMNVICNAKFSELISDAFNNS